MVSTFTPNIQLEEPARGDQVGTWDTPVNSNMTLLDLVSGGNASISLNNSPVVLSAAQFQVQLITFISTLTGNVTITFPTSFKKPYAIQNQCTGSSAFVITLATTAGGTSICCPPGETVDVFNDGSNLKYKNLGRVGEYWDYAGSSVPNWVSGCTVPPYLNCNGGTFSAATYPVLSGILGSTTLPDSRSRVRIALDQAASRMSSGTIGFSPNTVGAAGGDQSLQSHTHTNSVTDPTHTHSNDAAFSGGSGAGSVGGGGAFGFRFTQNVAAAATGISVSINSAGVGSGQNLQPSYIGGITMIRAG